MLKTVITLFTILLSSLLFSQEENKPNIQSGNINEKFDYVIDNSNNYQEFKVVKKVWLNQLKKQVSDSLQSKKSEINSLTKQVANQEKSISNLKTKVEELNNTIKEIDSNKEQINFLGINLKKDTFKTIFWATAIVLAILLLFFIYKFKNSNVVTKDTQSALNELEKDFEDHRRVALEREQKVMRKLQDEINKNKS